MSITGQKGLKITAVLLIYIYIKNKRLLTKIFAISTRTHLNVRLDSVSDLMSQFWHENNPTSEKFGVNLLLQCGKFDHHEAMTIVAHLYKKKPANKASFQPGGQ